jgi:glutamate 5-kinase
MRALNVKRLVVKVGTHTLTRSGGKLDRKRVAGLAEELASLRRQGRDVVLVSSGAIAAGLEALGIRGRPTDLPTLQAAASIGQGKLMELYSSIFEECGLLAGQVLLTQFDITHRQQYLNARNTMSRLLELGVVPVVNENDTVAVEEIRFGDNDRLAALVAGLVDADLLAILTDTDGLYTADPRLDGDAELIRRVERITPEVEELAKGTRSEHATGGMATKLQAARIATLSGVGVVILNGKKKGILARALEGAEIGTYFPPSKRKLAGRKRWIAFGLQPSGSVVIDEGAAQALLGEGKSLLPAGVLEVAGDFKAGDMVEVLDSGGRSIARGLSSYSSDELRAIKGMRSREAARLLGGACQEAIHRDCLVVLE